MSKTHPCRKCDAPLARSKHIVFSHHEAREEKIDPSSDTSSTVTVHDPISKHVPCPFCGEPKPLATIRANLATYVILGIAALLTVAAFVIVFLP